LRGYYGFKLKGTFG